jgi:nicotianamine synthase
MAAFSFNPGIKSLLASFPYYSNYVDLTHMELNAITCASPHTPRRRFAFLGCGPLPLTSLCILSQLSSPPASAQPFILNIDWSSDAIASATKLCQRLAIPETSMAFSCDCAGGARNDLSGFDVVYVAALVGATSKEKREIFSAVLKRMRPGALLVVRTAHALRKLLYPVSMPMPENWRPK